MSCTAGPNKKIKSFVGRVLFGKGKKSENLEAPEIRPKGQENNKNAIDCSIGFVEVPDDEDFQSADTVHFYSVDHETYDPSLKKPLQRAPSSRQKAMSKAASFKKVMSIRTSSAEGNNPHIWLQNARAAVSDEEFMSDEKTPVRKGWASADDLEGLRGRFNSNGSMESANSSFDTPLDTDTSIMVPEGRKPAMEMPDAGAQLQTRSNATLPPPPKPPSPRGDVKKDAEVAASISTTEEVLISHRSNHQDGMIPRLQQYAPKLSSPRTIEDYGEAVDDVVDVDDVMDVIEVRSSASPSSVSNLKKMFQ